MVGSHRGRTNCTRSLKVLVNLDQIWAYFGEIDEHYKLDRYRRREVDLSAAETSEVGGRSTPRTPVARA